MPSTINTNLNSKSDRKKPLTDKSIQAIKPREDGKERKIFDNHPDYPGLYIATSKTARKVFRLKCRFQGKDILLTLGQYPAMTLKLAREKALLSLQHIAEGMNPAEAKRLEKTKEPDTFSHWADLWYGKMAPSWSEVHCEDVRRNKLNLHVFPVIGDKIIPNLSKRDYESVLNPLKAGGKLETAKKIRSIMGQVIDYYINQTEREIVNWPERLRRDFVVSKQDRTHRAALILPLEVGQLMVAIEEYKNTSLLMHLALKFSALTFQRPGEIRKAEWQEIDWKERLWLLPSEKMKARRPHIVPLSKPVMALLKELHAITGAGKYLFPSVRSRANPMSEAGVLSALRRMGYGTHQMSAHGFRSTASTLLNEKGYNSDWIEAQLAHVEQNSVRQAYNHAVFLEQRREMM